MTASLVLCVFALPLGVRAFFGNPFISTAEVAQASSGLYVHRASETPVLKAATNLKPTGLGGGSITIVNGVALVAEEGPSGTDADIEVAKPESDQISTYVVRDGDTLSEIADMFGVSVNTIVWANDLKRMTIQPGQTLAILPVSGIKHTVAKGETLAGIIKKYKGDSQEVYDFNNLNSDSVLAVGDTVVIPYGVAPQVSSGSVSSGVSGPSIVGYFMKPVPGAAKTQGIHGYNGIDFGARTGANVLASASGEVIISRVSGWNGGYGQYIVIKHANGTQTLYAHLSQNYVFAGQQVSQGQVIGAVGNTGRSTGPHLHFEIRGARNPF